MRELTATELRFVSGGGDECPPDPDGGGNKYGGVEDVGGIGQDLIDFYEGLVEATSHIIERVALAL